MLKRTIRALRAACLLTLGLALVAALDACGSKGPLTLPKPQPAAQDQAAKDKP